MGMFSRLAYSTKFERSAKHRPRLHGILVGNLPKEGISPSCRYGLFALGRSFLLYRFLDA